jgi:uncharacterized surface protein with fasciclin (FAS1) repeats
MKRLIAGISPIAAAVGLALGTGSAFAQQAGQDQDENRSAFEQRANEAQDERIGPDRNQSQSESPASAQQGDQQQANRQQSDRQQQGTSKIDQLAEENSDLSKFVEALNTAGLSDALTGGIEYTVFAPTDSALEDEDIESLLQPENRRDLVAMLRAHIVADDVSHELAGNISQAQTIDGGTVEISMEDEKLMVGNAEATEADASGIDLGNLRVYKVDQLLGKGMPVARQAANRPAPSPAASESTEADDRSIPQ